MSLARVLLSQSVLVSPHREAPFTLRLSTFGLAILLGVGMVVLLAAAVSAAPIGLDVLAVVFDGLHQTIGTPVATPGRLAVNVDVLTIAGAVPLFHGIASAIAEPGILRATTTMSLTANQPTSAVFQLDTLASFSDPIVVSGPGVAFISATAAINGFGTGRVMLDLGVPNGGCTAAVASSTPTSSSCTTSLAATNGGSLLLHETL